MQIYQDHFENNMIMYGHDLWEYIERRLADPDGAVVMVHPESDKQHPSAPNTASLQPHLYLQQNNEADQASQVISQIEEILESDQIPEDIRNQLLQQKRLIELHPTQKALR